MVVKKSKSNVEYEERQQARKALEHLQGCSARAFSVGELILIQEVVNNERISEWGMSYYDVKRILELAKREGWKPK